MSAATRKNEWMAHIPDHPNAVDKRLSIRPQHLEKLKPRIESRTVVFGGATLSEKGEMTGSFVLIQADTEDEARDILKNDVYTQNGVWNVDAMTIWPFRSAFRTPVE